MSLQQLYLALGGKNKLSKVSLFKLYEELDQAVEPKEGVRQTECSPVKWHEDVDQNYRPTILICLVQNRTTPKAVYLEPYYDFISPKDRQFLCRWIGAVKVCHGDATVTVEELADELCMCQRQLLNRVKTITGWGPSIYLNGYRVAQAQRLLMTEALSICSISERAGFSSASAFSKVFRRFTGEAPGGFRDHMIATRGEIDASYFRPSDFGKQCLGSND